MHTSHVSVHRRTHVQRRALRTTHLGPLSRYNPSWCAGQRSTSARAGCAIVTVMSFQEELVSTREAARLIGRSPGAVRRAVGNGTLPSAGRTELGALLLRVSDVRAWHATHKQCRRGSPQPWNATADALNALGGATAEEVAGYLGIHVGNARKHLVILQAQGRAERASDGQWTTSSRTVGAA